MAKSKKSNKSNRSKNQRTNFVPSSSTVGKDNQFIETKVKPLIEGLASASEEVRSSSLSEITLLCENPKNRNVFLKERLLKYILDILSKNPSDEILTESYGLLRNITVEEGYDSAMFLYRQDIFNHASTILEKHLESIGAKTHDDLLENVLGLLSTMASSNDDIFDNLNEKLGDILSKVLVKTVQSFTNNSASPALFSTACESLYILSEDNQPFISQVSSLPLPDILSNPTKYTPLGMVYLNGLKYNSIHISLSNSTEELPNIAPSILEVCQAINTFISSVDFGALQRNITASAQDSKEAMKIYQEAIKSKYLIEGVQVSLEILSAIAETVSVDPKKQSPVQDEKMDENEDEDEDMDLYIRKAVSTQEENHYNDFIGFDNNDSLQATFQFIQSDIVPTLFKLLPYPEYLSRALNTLNNISWALESNSKYAVQWKQQAEQLWTELLPHVSSTDNKPFVEIESINSSISILWAIASFFNGVVPITLPIINFLISQSETISTLYPTDEVTEHYIRLVGLFTAVAKVPQQYEITQRIADYLLTLLDIVATKGASSVNGLNEKVAIEVLYAIFDVFGDGDRDYDDKVYVKGGLNSKLAVILPKIRNVFKRVSKVKDYALRERATEATMNLARFIEYKKAEKL